MTDATRAGAMSLPKAPQCIRLLVAGGVANHAHSGGTLLDHLLGTAALLELWRCPDYVICAGMTHSLFAAPFDKFLEPVAREQILLCMGARATRAAILFRLRGHTELFEAAERSEPSVHLAPRDLIDQAHLVAANFLDQFNRMGAAARPEKWTLAIDAHLCEVARGTLRQALAE